MRDTKDWTVVNGEPLPLVKGVVPDQCGNCTAWARVKGADGECRAVPPVPLLIGVQQAPRLQGLPNAGAQPMIHTFFPAIKEHGWCRCHVRKSTQP